MSRRIVPGKVVLHGAKHRFGRFPTATHFTEPDQAIVRLHLDDGPDETAPMYAIRMPQRRFEGNSHRRRTNVYDFHLFANRSNLTVFCPGIERI